MTPPIADDTTTIRIFDKLTRIDDKFDTLTGSVHELDKKVAVIESHQVSMSGDVSRALKRRAIPWKTIAGAVVAMATAIIGVLSYVS